MFGVQSSKCLITIVKDFNSEFEDELTVKNGEIVQFVSKLDRYWFEVYSDNRTGKVPISSCREWNSTEMSSIRLVRPTQAAFVSKYDFLNNCEEGDLRFSSFEVIIGFGEMNKDWWQGARLASIKNSIVSLSVKDEACGIFPLTHVWRLREDLLPENVFSENGVNIERLDEIKTAIEADSTRNDANSPPEQISTSRSFLFYVKVIKTMKSHLNEEMDLPEVDEILGVSSIPDKLYYNGKSLDGARCGLFPQNFVRIVDNYEPSETNCDQNSTCSTSPSPSPNPPTIPPPSPPHITINFGKHLSVDFTGGATPNSKVALDTPPSYEAAICCEPVSYGYVDNMFSGIDSYGRVLFDFEAQNDNEISLRENQIVRLYRHVDDDWMEGEIDGKVGFLPKSYISIIVDCEVEGPSNEQPSGPSTTKPGSTNQVVAINYPLNTKAKILYDFDPEMEQDLRVRAGDIVTLLQHFTSTDWVEAMDSGGNVGFVHLNFCELINSNNDLNLSQSINSRYANIGDMSIPPSTEGHSKRFQNDLLPPAQENGSSPFEAKPQRPAPPAPRRTNVFPTFNQFLFDDKQEILQYELEHEQPLTPIGQASTDELGKEVHPGSSTKNKRQCVITELIQTERDYCHAMNVCLNVFRSNSTEAERCGVDTEKLFADMRTVVNVSKSLVKLLDNYANNRPYVDQRVGVCFLDLKFEIKDAYTKYCRNHDSTNMLLRSYEADSKSNDFMRRCQSKIQDQTNCFDISSIVIKPVQRILKYPLLLNELIKCTENTHIDWDPLLMALQMITDIATSINEHKRRQDLIEKYCKVTDTSFSGRLKNLNKHTVMKKSSRLANRVISTLTFSSSHKDENFDAALIKFASVDKSIKTFVKSMKDYIHSMKEYYIQTLVVANAILEYYGTKREVEQLRSTHNEIYHKYFADFTTVIERDVIALLVKLSEKFKAPWILINKRKDKLIDYDASLKSKNDSNLAKNTFEALNQQLIEELPLLTDLSVQIFNNCLQTLMSANKNVICRTARLFLNMHQLPFIKNSPFGFYQDIEEAFRVKHSLVFQQILRDFSLIHASTFPNANGSLSEATSTSSTLNRLHRSSNTWKNSLPARKSSQIDSSVTSERRRQDDKHKRNLERKYKAADLYTATSTYIPCDVFDLYVESEDLIGVIKRKDPSGQEHRWYVDRGEAQGFLPQSILTPYRKPIDLFQTQLSVESCSSLVSSTSSDRSTPLVSHENIDLLTDSRYDTVPEEDIAHVHSNHSSLLSFDEIDHPASIENTNSLLDITSQFDPLTPEKAKPTLEPLNSLKPSRPAALSSLSNSRRNSILENVYHAAYPFKAADENQLSMEFGQKVVVKQKCDLQGNQEWWFVINSSDKEGYVPANYLRKS